MRNPSPPTSLAGPGKLRHLPNFFPGPAHGAQRRRLGRAARTAGLKNDAELRHWMRARPDDPLGRRVQFTSADQVNDELLDILARALDQNT